MAWPDDAPLGTKVMLNVGGVWTDITQYTYLTSPITITRGRADEGARADFGRATIALKNQDGRFSPRNPMSPYYGKIGRNTPLYVSVQAGSSYLSCGGGTGFSTGAQTPDTAVLDIVGDVDVRVDATLENWITAGVIPSVELAGKFNSAGNQKSWLFQARDGALHFEWSVNGSTVNQVNSTAKLTIRPNRRLAVRVVLDVDNGAAGNTVTFYTSTSLSGTWTQLGDPIVTAGVTSIFNSTAPLRVARGSDLSFTNPDGQVWGAEIRNGIGGTIVAAPNFRPLAPGSTSFTDTAGRAWTVQVNTSVSNERIRFFGEVSAWPSEWDVGGRDVRAPIEASGILRRLRQGKSALASPLRRRIPTFAPVAYWPMEEGSTATQTNSPIAGVAPLRVTGFTFAADATLAGSGPLPSIGAAASMIGAVPASPGSVTAWQVEMVYNLPAMPSTVQTMLEINTLGTIRKIGINVYSNMIQVIGIDDTDTPQMLVNQPNVAQFSGAWNRLRFSAVQNGANIDYTLAWVVIGSGFVSLTGSFAGTLSRVTSVGSPFGPSSGLPGLRLGHLAVFNAINTTAFDSADIAFNGETASTRLTRLCAEQGVPLSLFGTASDSEKMGPQTSQAFLDLLGEAPDVDHGILYERRGSAALAYRDRISLYNQPAGLALDYTARGHVAPPLKPVEDDQGLKNDRTVQRVNGTYGHAVLASGPLSVQDPPNGMGQVDDAVTLNLYDDSQPAQHANWSLFQGTWDEARFTSVHVLLHRAPGLIDDASGLDSGDIMTIANPPAWLPPDGIDLMARGYTEVLGVRTWDITFNTTPAGPWTVGVTDDPVLGRADTDGSSLASSATSTATTLSVATASGPIWPPDPAETPWDIRAGGEVMTVTTVGSVLNANPFFGTDVSGWTGSNAAILRNAGRVYPGGGAVASLQMTPNGTSASGGANCALTGAGSITPGAQYTASMWAYCFAGLADARACVDWYDAAGVFLSTSLGVGTVLPVATWTMLQQTLTAPALASQAVLRARHGGTPSAATLWNVWAARLVPALSYSASPQTFTVVRSVNGIVKAQTSSTAVSLANPAPAAL